MNKLLTAVALTIAIPAVATAQGAPAAKDCCKTMKDDCCKSGKVDCCKEMQQMMKDGHHQMTGMNMPAGHDMSGSADAHAGHDMSQSTQQPQR